MGWGAAGDAGGIESPGSRRPFVVTASLAAAAAAPVTAEEWLDQVGCGRMPRLQGPSKTLQVPARLQGLRIAKSCCGLRPTLLARELLRTRPGQVVEPEFLRRALLPGSYLRDVNRAVRAAMANAAATSVFHTSTPLAAVVSKPQYQASGLWGAV